MKVLVIGTGSIGTRHINNLLSLQCEVFAFSYRGKSNLPTHWQGKVKFVKNWFNLLSVVDAVVIANTTSLHVQAAITCSKAGIPFFIEKPLSHNLQGFDELTFLVTKHSLVVETGFMMRFHPNLRLIKDKVDSNEFGPPLYLRAFVGQWLPDWRPGTDHRLGYGAFRATGGGVIFDLIHELDLVQWILGPVEYLCAMVQHSDKLQIETEAIAQISLRTFSGALAQVHLDYVRPNYGRELEVVCEDGVLTWSYLTGIVRVERKGRPPEILHCLQPGFERNTMFLDHMKHFIKRISDKKIPPASSLEDGINAVRLAVAAHQSTYTHEYTKPFEANFSY